MSDQSFNEIGNHSMINVPIWDTCSGLQGRDPNKWITCFGGFKHKSVIISKTKGGTFEKLIGFERGAAPQVPKGPMSFSKEARGRRLLQGGARPLCGQAWRHGQPRIGGETLAGGRRAKSFCEGPALGLPYRPGP